MIDLPHLKEPPPGSNTENKAFRITQRVILADHDDPPRDIQGKSSSSFVKTEPKPQPSKFKTTIAIRLILTLAQLKSVIFCHQRYYPITLRKN